MQRLEAGIHQFQANYFENHRHLFEHLATKGQNPEALFVTCSDSRVVPNLITSSGPGELFIVRNIGNIIPPPENTPGGVSAAVEYAVEVLNVSNVIVCGHTDCGAMQAILHPERVKHLPYVRRWLAGAKDLPTLIEERYGHLDPDARLTAAVEENVLVQLENLRTFDFVARRLESGALKMNGWVFKIATGEVFDFDPVAGQFLPLGRKSTFPPPPLAER